MTALICRLPVMIISNHMKAFDKIVEGVKSQCSFINTASHVTILVKIQFF